MNASTLRGNHPLTGANRLLPPKLMQLVKQILRDEYPEQEIEGVAGGQSFCQVPYWR